MSVIYINSYQLVAAGGGDIDPYFSNVSLLLHGDGANDSTTIVDSSPRPKTITTFGGVRISTAQGGFGGSSLYFDETVDYLNAGSADDFNFGTGAFTVECFINFVLLPGGGQYTGIVGTQNSVSSASLNHWWLGIYNSGTPRLYLGRHGNANDYVSVNWTPSLNTRYHIAATRDDSGVPRLFINGASQNVTISGAWGGSAIDFAAPGELAVGIIATSLSLFGYIDELRLTKGVARYTSDFTPPTAPFPDA